MERRGKRRKRLTRDQLLGIANYLTYGRIAMAPLIVLLMMVIHDDHPAKISGNILFGWLSMIAFTIAQSSDIIDGYYARKYGVISSFGKFIDPLADKLLSMSSMVMLVALHRMEAWMAVTLMARDVSITALRGIAASEGVEIAASNWGKRKTVFLSIALGALMIHYPFWGIHPRTVGIFMLWISLLISIGSGIHYIMTFFNEVIEKKKTGSTLQQP